MKYFETNEYEMQKNQLLQLLTDFYHATNIPIMLLSHSASTLAAIPEHMTLSTPPTEVFNVAREWDTTSKISINHITYIVSPIIAIQGLFGFLCVSLPEDTREEITRGFIRFLELTKKEIIENDLILLQYQRYLDQFKASIYNILDTDLSVSSLCQVMNVGKTKLSSDFKKYAGTTIAKFILNVRMEKAQVLLSTTNLTITEISENVGFNDYNYFCRVFKKYYGMSPQNYRLSHTI